MTTTRQRHKTAKSKLAEALPRTDGTQTYTIGKGKRQSTFKITFLAGPAAQSLVKNRTHRQMASKVVALLNQALQTDPDLVNGLVNTKFLCKSSVSKHWPVTHLRGKSAQTSALGLVNGVVELLTGFLVLAHFRPEKGSVIPTRLIGFDLAERNK